jgi:hypothetical protein
LGNAIAGPESAASPRNVEMKNKLENCKQSAASGIRVAGYLALMAFCLLLLSACAGTAVQKEAQKSDDEIVVERAKARWTAMLDRDMETAYGYYSPGYRSTTSVVDFMFNQRSRRVKWESAEYLGHSCTESACEVRFKTGFRIDKAVPGMDVYHGFDTIEETWVKTNGEWWFVPAKG